MNLRNIYTENEISLMKKVGVNIENRDYTNDELKLHVCQITEFIMSHSTKNGEISSLLNQYSEIIEKING